MSNSGGCSESGTGTGTNTNCTDTVILGDGDHGTPALNVTAVRAWNKTVRITFRFPSKVRVTGMNLYFYNNPSRNIGLPYDTDVTSNPDTIACINCALCECQHIIGITRISILPLHVSNLS